MSEADSGEGGVASKTCQNCKNAESKYRCPGCGMRTCSLPCSKAHRESTGCTGKRSRSGLVKLPDFTERQLLTDIRFIEEVERECDAAKRREPQRLPARLPHLLQELQREAGRRHIRLQFLGPGMEKRLQNSTFHNRKAKKLLWHIEWVFVRAKLHIYDRRIAEDCILRGLLDKHVRPQRRGFKDDEKMLPYTKAGTSGLVILMRQPRAQVGDIRHHKMELDSTLTSQLEGKYIMEFPVFLVLLPEEASEYQLVGPGTGSGCPDEPSNLSSSGEEVEDEA